MRYEFHPEALEEYRQASLWYVEREPAIVLQFKHTKAKTPSSLTLPISRANSNVAEGVVVNASR